MDLAQITKSEMEKMLKYAERRTKYYQHLSKTIPTNDESQSKRISYSHPTNTHCFTNQAR